MLFKIESIVFTDISKEGQPLINRVGQPFFMLHLEVSEWPWASIEANEHWKIISKYYVTNESDKLLSQIKVWETYNIEYSVSWIYKNVISVRDLNNNIII